MALALRISAPYITSYRRPLAFGLVFPRCSCSVYFRCSGGRAIRCNAAESGDTSGQAGGRNTGAASHSPSWEHAEPTKDAYSGWEPLDRDYDIDRRTGLLQIGAGVVLAIAFSLVTYTVYSRKGSKHSVEYTVTTKYHKQNDVPSRSSPDDSRNAQKPLAPDTTSTPSSNKSKQEFHGENPQPDVASASDLHQKKTAPGQDSFPSKDVTKFSDEEDDFSSESFTDSDLESNDEHAPRKSETVENQATSTPKELEQPISDPASAVKESDELPTDDNAIVASSDTPVPVSDLAGPSPDKSVHESASESMSINNVPVKENEQSGENSIGNDGSTEYIKGPQESGSAVAKPEDSLTVEPGEPMLKVSASLVVPKGATEDVLEILGLETDSNVDALDLSATEPGILNKSPSLLETPSSPLGSEFWQSESVESFGIPAPSTPSAAAQARSGSIVVPATVDHEQEQALAALQALKVIESDVELGGICTRREYARWLIAITGALARSPAQKVFPAMYIDSVSELAFNDVVPEDPDFPYIQGLAEAGLISSNLSRHDANENGRSTDGSVFLPDSPLSRQDLICWKVALEGHTLQATDKKKFKAQTGFVDIDRIDENALPFLAVDLAAGERSIISTAFGYTKRFQPGKPVTRGQVAMALVTGDASDVVAEELTRLEADDIAEAAVVAELSLEVRAQKHLDEYFNTELKVEKDSRLSAEKRFEEVKKELDRVIKEREDQRLSLECMQATVQAERDLLHKFRQDMEEQLETLTTHKAEVGIEKDRLESLRKEGEVAQQALADNKAAVEVERQALILARLWAEDEAKKARGHAKILEQVRKRWEGQGIQVRVNKELDDDNIPALSWRYGGPNTEMNKFVQRPPMQDILARAGDLKSRVVERFFQLLELIGTALNALRQKIAESFYMVREKGAESLQVVREKGTESLRVVREKGTESLRVVGGKVHVFQQDTLSRASVKAQEVQDATRSTVAGVSSSVTEGTRKIADGFRGEAQKLAGKFKS